MAIRDDLAPVIKRAQALEQSALAELVDEYASRLYGFLYRLTGRREDAEDLVQEVFVRMVRMIGSYQDDGRFEGWLFRIATNLARDLARRDKRRPSISSLDVVDHDGTTNRPDSAPNDGHARSSPTRVMELAEDANQLQTFIDMLPDAEREVILLRHYAQMSFAQIAEAMETPLGTALARAHRGLRKLRGWMEPTA